MSKVNLLLIGAGRSGTTTLYRQLMNHPQVEWSNIKEVQYFSVPNLFKRGEQYLNSFFTKTTKPVIATSDTYLLVDDKAPQKVKKYNPEMKILVILRNPVDRAYSSYQYAIANGYELDNTSFAVTRNNENGRLESADIITKNNRYHFWGSLYHHHLQAWSACFNQEQICIVTTENLTQQPDAVYNKICSFLNIEAIPDFEYTGVHNKSTKAKSTSLQNFLANRNHPLRNATRWLVKPFGKLIIKSGIVDLLKNANQKNVRYQPLSETERNDLSAYFKEDLAKLKSDYDISFTDM